MLVWGTAQALGFDTRVDGLGEGCVLDDAGGFAGVIGEALALPRGLHAAIVHVENQRGFVRTFDAVAIDLRIEAAIERGGQRIKRVVVRNVVCRFDARRLEW